MDDKRRFRQKPLISRLQFRPENTEVPHMAKGKFIKPEQTSSAEEDESSLFFPAETPFDLRTAVYRADTARKRKIKTKEGEKHFEYIFSRIHKKKVKEVIDQPTKMTEWDRYKTLEYSEMKNIRKKLSIIPFYEESSYTTDMSTDILSETEDKGEESEIQTVSTQMSCHRRTCMQFHRFLRQKKAPPSYDTTEPIDDDVILHILRLREKLGWQTSLLPQGFIAKQRDSTNFQKILLSEALQEDDGEYVYCLIRSRDDPKAAYDPYDLHVVSADLARQSKEYWTITATYVSKFTIVCGKEEMEIIPIMEWLYERQLYYASRSIEFCFIFRKLKYFIIWKNNVKRTKIKKSKMVMYDQLFIADEILQKCLLYIQALCLDVSNPTRYTASEDITIHFIKIDISHTYTLDEFCEKQYQQSQQALSQIQAFKDKVIKVIQDSFLKIAEMKGAGQLFQHLSDDVKEKPKYFQIAKWRHIMEKFSGFLQLVDRIFQELLRRLVHNAVDLLLEIFKGSSSMAIPKQKTNENLIRLFKNTIERANNLLVTEDRCLWMIQDNYFQRSQESSYRSKEPEVQREIVTVSDIDKIVEEVKRFLKGEEEYSPVFEVDICLRIPYEKDYRRKYYQDDDDYIPEEPTESLREHKDLKELSQNDSRNKLDTAQELSNDESQGSEANYEPVMYESSPGFYTDIYLFPNRREFSLKMQGILDGLENTIDQVVPFSQDPQLSIFIVQSLHNTMQSYELYMVPQPDQYIATWPNCDLILGTDPDYESKIVSLLSLQSCSLGQVECYSRNFMEYCCMLDKAKNTTDKISALKREMSTQEFRNILENYTADIKEIVCMIIERHICMFKVKSLKYQTDCLPYFEALLKKIHTCFYAAMDSKNVHLVEVTKTAVANLSKELTTVDGFIEHLQYLHEISSQLPRIQIQYNSLSQLYFIAKDYDIFLPLQQLALYQTVVRTLQILQSTVLVCEKMKDDYIIKFNEGLREYIDNLQDQLREYKNKVRNPVLLLSETLPKTANEMIQSLIEESEVISEQIMKCANYQTIFDNSISDMKSVSLEKLSHRGQAGDCLRVNAEFAEIESELVLRKLLWDSQEEWTKLYFKWKRTIFWNLDVDLIQREVNRFMQIILILEKGLPENTILPVLQKSLVNFKNFLPIIISLRNPCLQSRHWETIQNIIGHSVFGDKRLTLEKILELDIFQYKKEISEVSVTATNETTLEVMLKKIIALWHNTDFHLFPYHSETSKTSIISSAEEIVALLEDSLVTISTIKASYFVGPIKGLVDTWNRKLNLFSSTLEEWLTCQRNWIYLEPIFHAPEIKRQLPEESKLFSQVDNKWKDLMKHTGQCSNALQATTATGVLEMLQSNNACLEKIQKALEDHLDVKRMIFPRFYFLSNAELLEILSESKNHDAVQPHLVKCFSNIRKLYIRLQEQRPPVILMMRSAEGEILLLPKNVHIRGPVEQWLGNVESTMYDMVKRFITVGIAEWSQMQFKEWFFTHPGQVILIVSQMMFTQECEACLKCSNRRKEMRVSHDDLSNLIEQLAEIASDVLPYHKQSTLEALVTLFIHCREVLNTLIDLEIRNTEDFEWIRHLRYVWQEMNPCRVIQGYASFDYGYEYLGCSPRLVITPLTDRCWLTLTGALELNLGGCLAGPAGTGKTETVKDLSKALGKLCLSFNCSEGLDDKVMGKMFCGLVQSGSWCCFDEFNRIDLEVLSAIASQIQAIKAAKDSLAIRFVLEGKEIRLKPFSAIFITMNPGYKSRVELPDNLKSLFRPVSMMVPDYELIVEIMLFSEGFKSAKLNAGKIINLYHLSSKQLSQQDHYDFGMRAIKTVLIRVGQKRQNLKMSKKKKSFSTAEETLIIMSTLKEVNLPKFLADDVSLFEGILTDLFPEMKVPKVNPERLEDAVSLAIQHLHLQPWESQIEKVIQFYNQLMGRVGIMLVGPTGGGKTTIRRILEKAMTILPLADTKNTTKLDAFQNSSKRGKVDTFVINPKCVTLGELFGETNPSTMEWSDGLLPSAVRSFAKFAAKKPKKKDSSRRRNYEVQDLFTLNTVNKADAVVTDDTLQSTENANCEIITDWQWIIFDGPVDPIWIENLNSALDDTRMLCLANSERIYLSPGIRMIFEVDSLAQASPATVSRCAMIYVDPVDLGWQPYVKTWLKAFSKILEQNDIEYLESLFYLSIERGLDFLNQHKKMQAFPIHEMGIVMNICRLISSFIHIMKQDYGLQSSNIPISVSFSTGIQNNATQFIDSATSFSGVVPSIKKKRAGPRWFWETQPNKMQAVLGKLFIFAFTWAVGGILRREEEHEGETLIGIATSHDELAKITRDFNYLVHDLFEGKPPTNIQIPSGDKTVFDYFVDLQSGEFEPWGNLVPNTQILIQKGTLDLPDSDNKVPENQGKKKEATFISNIDTIRHSFLTSLLLLNKHPVLIIGDSGSGKTVMIENMLQRLQKQGGLNMNMGTILGEVFYYGEIKKISLLKSFSNMRSDTLRNPRKRAQSSTKDFISALNLNLAREENELEESSSESTKGAMICTLQLGTHTSAVQTKAWILQRLILKSKDVLGAPQSKQVLLFIDDLNTPIPEEYGSQPPLELIRQFLDLGGFYDTRHLEWKHVQDIALVASCTPPSEGNNKISARLLTHFCTFVLPTTSLQSLQRIFQVRLGIHFYNNRFLTEVQKCTDYLTCSSIALYYRMFHKMRPTPAKCHYIFNLRDLFKVLEGLLQAHRTIIVSKEMTALFFVHESARVFHDRLVDSVEQEIFYQFLASELNNYFKISWTKEKLMKDETIFVDFLDSSIPVEKRIYRNVTSQKRFLLAIESYIRMQATKPESTSIVFFKELIQHITRAARIFRQGNAHMTLIGLDGNGKVTCASLGSCLSDCNLYKLSVTSHYSSVNFREDLRNVYKQTGLEGKRTVFLLTDSDIIQESFLEDLSCVLKSGEVPNLFEKDELDNIVLALTSAAEKTKQSIQREDAYSMFLQRVRCNLHVVLTISPTGIIFRQCCRTYPAIINCCTVDWYENWPEEALCHVAESYFSNNDMFGNENFRNMLVPMCVNIHKNLSIIIEKYLKETKRHYYVTPKSYLQLIYTFSSLLQSTKEKTLKERASYHAGLTKILEATSHITDMQDELLILGPQIEEKSQEIEELVERLHKDALVVEEVRTIVKEDEAIMAAETRIVEEYAKQATDELNVVLPSLEKALNALNALDKSHIAEIRVYTHPPPLVLTVLNAVCVLLQKKPNWATAKLLLADPGFLKKLINLDKDNLPEKIFEQLKKYMKSPDFNPVKVGLVSVACCSMCQWILALDHYHSVKKFVEPKQAKVSEAEELLKLAYEKLAKKQRSLALIEEHQQHLETKYGESIAEKEKLAARKNQTIRRLRSASVLSIALKDEMERWKESVKTLDQKLQDIVGDTLVSAACIVYSGVLSAGYRQQLVDTCLKLCNDNNISVSPNYSLVNCMTEKNEVRKWQNEGLPLDQYSTENAIHVKYGLRWPLLIDPERQAYKWICQIAGGKLRHIRVTDANYLRTLENSVRLGESVLLQDLTETLDSTMKPILKKEIFNKGGQDFIKIGETNIEYNQDFRLYLTTLQANPHFLPAICNTVTMINFTVTFQGLQDQLLSAVVIKEEPELEQKRCELLESISTDFITLRELEQKSLRFLQKTNGHILDDQDLIDNLQRTKITSTEIFERVGASAATEAAIETLRKNYLPIATRGSVLYFVVADLVHINYMYQFSLQWFHKIFADSVDDINKQKSEVSLSTLSRSKSRIIREQSRFSTTQDLDEADDFKRHVGDIMDKLTSNIYKTVSTALFSENQVCFAFLLCTAIMKNNCNETEITNNLGLIKEDQWNFFLHSSIMANIMETQDSKNTGSYAFMKTPPHWITEMMWKECQYMSAYMPGFSILCDSLVSNSQQWAAFLNSQNVYYLTSTCYNPVSSPQDPKSEDIQESDASKESDDQISTALIFPWHELSSFERLTLIKVLRLERLNSAVQEFVIEKLGSKYNQTKVTDLKAVYQDSDSITPLILIHAQGVDIAAVLLRLAQEIKGSSQHVNMISLGRGQGAKAEEVIYKAQVQSGQWVFLQNCHLAASFMPRLCTIVDLFTKGEANINTEFRLWLSSTPDTSFPVHILRKGLKVVIEPPRGLKATLLQTFGLRGTGLITEALFSKTTCGPSWKRILFSLCFFNAIVHERKKYGALGWNIPYEFNTSDLEISIQILEMLLERQKKISWPALHYLTGEIAYGGRVTDSWDRRSLLSILDNFYNPSMLQEDFAYSADQVYRPISEAYNLRDCRAYIHSLPEADSPELFGMHHCAERAYLKNQAQLFLHSLVNTQPAISTDTFTISGRKSQDEIVLEIVSDILIKLPLTVEDIGRVAEPEDDTAKKNSLANFKAGPVWAALVKATEGPGSFINSTLLTVLQQEIDQYNNLLSIIINSLHSLQQSIKGDIIFTTGLEEIYNSILKTKVPQLWQKHSYKTCKSLGSWIEDLIIGVNFFATWSNQVITFMQSRFTCLMMLQRQTKTLLQFGEDSDFFSDSYQGYPSCFWLPGFFFPCGFLTAVLLNYARQNKIPVDSLTFTHKVLPIVQDEGQDLRGVKRKEVILNKAFKESSHCESGIIIFGLYLDGACWNPLTEALEEPELHKRFYELPNVLFLPQQMGFNSRHYLEDKADVQLYECPLYRTPERSGMLSSTGISTNFVTEVYLPSLIAPRHWITRGVALLCQLED